MLCGALCGSVNQLHDAVFWGLLVRRPAAQPSCPAAPLPPSPGAGANPPWSAQTTHRETGDRRRSLGLRSCAGLQSRLCCAVGGLRALSRVAWRAGGGAVPRPSRCRRDSAFATARMVTSRLPAPRSPAAIGGCASAGRASARTAPAGPRRNAVILAVLCCFCVSRSGGALGAFGLRGAGGQCFG